MRPPGGEETREGTLLTNGRTSIDWLYTALWTNVPPRESRIPFGPTGTYTSEFNMNGSNGVVVFVNELLSMSYVSSVLSAKISSLVQLANCESVKLLKKPPAKNPSPRSAEDVAPPERAPATAAPLGGGSLDQLRLPGDNAQSSDGRMSRLCRGLAVQKSFSRK